MSKDYSRSLDMASYGNFCGLNENQTEQLIENLAQSDIEGTMIDLSLQLVMKTNSLKS